MKVWNGGASLSALLLMLWLAAGFGCPARGQTERDGLAAQTLAARLGVTDASEIARQVEAERETLERKARESPRSPLRAALVLARPMGRDELLRFAAAHALELEWATHPLPSSEGAYEIHFVHLERGSLSSAEQLERYELELRREIERARQLARRGEHAALPQAREALLCAEFAYYELVASGTAERLAQLQRAEARVAAVISLAGAGPESASADPLLLLPAWLDAGPAGRGEPAAQGELAGAQGGDALDRDPLAGPARASACNPVRPAAIPGDPPRDGDYGRTRGLQEANAGRTSAMNASRASPN